MSSILLHREHSCEDRPTRSTSGFRVERFRDSRGRGKGGRRTFEDLSFDEVMKYVPSGDI